MKTYEDGLNEAWEVARKIVCNDGYNFLELEDIFERRSISDILKTNTIAEAIDKIEKYESKVFEVGDEVVNAIGKKSVAMRVSDEYITVVEGDGTASIWEKKGFKKTGRHFPQIDEILKELKEDENDSKRTNK